MKLLRETTMVTITHKKANFYGVFKNEVEGARMLKELGIRWNVIRKESFFEVAPYFRSYRFIRTIELE